MQLLLIRRSAPTNKCKDLFRLLGLRLLNRYFLRSK
jgi:hypothetical protein